MSNGIISLDEISGNGGSSTDSNNNSGSDDGDAFSELRSACEAIGADVENAISRVKSDDGADEESLIELANELSDSDELWHALEEYRAYNDQHRLKQNHLLSSDKEFTNWSSAFYGDSDDPSEGTYNFVQQRARDELGGNLYYYKALFPEPDLEHYPSDSAVLWQERPGEDSHIYVTEQFVEEYGQFTLEIDGEERPVPPWDSASQDSWNGSGEAFDEAVDALDMDAGTVDARLEGYPAPNGLTVDELKETYRGMSDSVPLEIALEIEKATKDRKTAKSFLRGAIDDAEQSDDSSGSSDEEITVTIDGQEVTGTPEDIRALKGL